MEGHKRYCRIMKKIGITCDSYKTDVFREGLTEEGYAIEFDGESGIQDTHLFRIAVADSDFEETKTKLIKTLKRLELKIKRSN